METATCPICGATIELPIDLDEDMALTCEDCGAEGLISLVEGDDGFTEAQLNEEDWQ